MSTSLLCSRAYRITNSEAYVFADSVLLSGEKKWEMILLRLGRAKVNGFSENNHFKDMNRIDGMPTEFEWKKYFPGIPVLGLLEKIPKLLTDLQCEPEHFTGRIIFMSMFNDIVWDAQRNKEQCEHKSQTVANYAREFRRGHWSFLGPGPEKEMVRNLH